MKAVIVEDSRLARLELKEQLKHFNDIEVVAEAENVAAGLELIHALKPDLLFLDIHMPQQTGFDLLEQITYEPMVIFTTAFSEHAYKSFEYDTVDYLLKPIVLKRLTQAVEKARYRLTLNQPSVMDKESKFFVKDGQKNWFVRLEQVRLFESIGNYCRIHFDDAKPMVYKSLSALEKRLPDKSFFRANRNQIINVEFIESIDTNVGGSIEIILIDGSRVDVSRRQTAAFKDRWGL